MPVRLRWASKDIREREHREVRYAHEKARDLLRQDSDRELCQDDRKDSHPVMLLHGISHLRKAVGFKIKDFMIAVEACPSLPVPFHGLVPEKHQARKSIIESSLNHEKSEILSRIISE